MDICAPFLYLNAFSVKVKGSLLKNPHLELCIMLIVILVMHITDIFGVVGLVQDCASSLCFHGGLEQSCVKPEI